jgi:hypothetical protein
MDPYLETSWGSLHVELIVYARDQLHEQRPSDLAARIHERLNPTLSGRIIRQLRILECSPELPVVTVIEFLTAADKVLKRGEERYQSERAHWIGEGISLVEIDLLRAGGNEWFPMPPGAELPKGDYRIAVHRAWKERRSEVHTVSVRERLPVIPIPLRPDDSDAVLDLQGLIDRCYQRGRYELTTHYEREPDPPLTDDDRAWADGLLRAAGKRQ